MKISTLDTSIDHSEALKAALTMRVQGTSTDAVENALGTILYNIARWALSEKDRQWREHEDMVSEINLKLLMTLPRIDLTKNSMKILGYLKKTATNTILDMQKASRRQKRSAELVDVDVLQIATDFRGNLIQ
jgi:DNA-directed RNA polymerase specialized sigma24 family protein